MSAVSSTFLDHSKWLVAIAPKVFFPLFRMGFRMDVTTETCPEFRLVTNVSYTLFHMLHKEHLRWCWWLNVAHLLTIFTEKTKYSGLFSERIFEYVKGRQCFYVMYFQAPSLFSHNAITMHVMSITK